MNGYAEFVVLLEDLISAKIVLARRGAAADEDDRSTVEEAAEALREFLRDVEEA